LHSIRPHGQNRDADVQFGDNDLLLQFARKNQHSKTPFKAEKVGDLPNRKRKVARNCQHEDPEKGEAKRFA
jgi:hypothetical protein